MDLTLQWLRQVSLPYQDSNRVCSDVQACLQVYHSLRPKTDVFTFNDGRTQLLICVHGLLPISFRSSTYNIPIAIWLTLDHPRDAPIVYVLPTSDMLIKASKNVDANGLCHIDYLKNWERKSEGCDLVGLCKSMQDLFSKEPPVYAKPRSTSSTPSQSISAASSSSSPRPISTGPSSYASRPPPSLPTSSEPNTNLQILSSNPENGIVNRSDPSDRPLLPPKPAQQPSIPVSSYPGDRSQRGINSQNNTIAPMRPTLTDASQAPFHPPVVPSNYPYGASTQSPSSVQAPLGQIPHPNNVLGQPDPSRFSVQYVPAGAIDRSAQSVSPSHSFQAPLQPTGPYPVISPQTTGASSSSRTSVYGSIQPSGSPVVYGVGHSVHSSPIPSATASPPQAGVHNVPGFSAAPQAPAVSYAQPFHPTPGPPHPSLAPKPQSQPVPNLLDDDGIDVQTVATEGPAPPRPPNPELVRLHVQLHAKLNAELSSLATTLAADAERLRKTQQDLLAGEPAIRDEMGRLEAVRDVCRTVAGRYSQAVAAAEQNVRELRRKGDPEVDELVCSTSIVHNQLINLVAEDNAIEDTMYHLQRALNAGRIDLERFLRTTRALAEEQFTKRALIEKITSGIPMGMSMGWS